MSKDKKSIVPEIVVRIRPNEGRKGLSLEDLKAILGGQIIEEVEGGTIDAEILAVTVRAIIKEHIVEPLKDIPIKMVEDIAAAWADVKEPLEKLLQHRFAQCVECGAYALSDAMHSGDPFICPCCQTKSKWKFIPDAKHPGGGRYILEK